MALSELKSILCYSTDVLVVFLSHPSYGVRKESIFLALSQNYLHFFFFFFFLSFFF